MSSLGSPSVLGSSHSTTSSASYTRDKHGNMLDPNVYYMRKKALSMHPDVMKAQEKLEHVAANWDTASKGPLQGFNDIRLNPTEFREIFKNNFGTLLNAKDLGSLVSLYDKEGNGHVDCNDFLKSFYATGRSKRRQRAKEHALLARRVKQRQQERRQEKIERMTALKTIKVGAFTEADRDRALERLRKVAAFYSIEKSGSLNSFARGGPMDAATFREQLKANFGTSFTNAELGALMQEFDADGDGTVDGPEFCFRFQQIARHAREAKLHERHHANYILKNKKQQQLQGLQERFGALAKTKVNWNFTEDDVASAMAKIAKEAKFYDRERNGSLSDYLVGSYDPTSFRAQLRQTLGIQVTSSELGAMYSIFDRDKSGTIEGSEFLCEFFRIGREERQHDVMRARRAKARIQRQQERFKKKLEDRFVEQTTARVIWPEIDDEMLGSALPTMGDGCSSVGSSVTYSISSARDEEQGPESNGTSGKKKKGGKKDQLPQILQVSESTANFLKEVKQAERRIANMTLNYDSAGKKTRPSAGASGGKQTTRKIRRRRKKKARRSQSSMSGTDGHGILMPGPDAVRGISRQGLASRGGLESHSSLESRGSRGSGRWTGGLSRDGLSAWNGGSWAEEEGVSEHGEGEGEGGYQSDFCSEPQQSPKPLPRHY
ncbi:unnamed protein product [Chrysoparadoxa australica]